MLQSKRRFGREMPRCPITLILLVSIEAAVGDVLCVKATVVVFVIDEDDIMEEGLEPVLTAMIKEDPHSENLMIITCSGFHYYLAKRWYQ